MARRASKARTTAISPTKFGKGPMGGPTAPQNTGTPNRAAIARNTSSKRNPLR